MKKILFGLCLSIILSAATYSFSIGGFIKNRVDDAVNDTVQKQLISVSKTSVNFLHDKTYVEVKGTVKNKGPQAYVQVIIPCYDKKGAKIGDAVDSISDLKSQETWEFHAYARAEGGQKIEKCDLKQLKINGKQY